MVNGIAVLMMVFLISTRRKNRESLHQEDRVYDSMAIITIIGAIIETISFLVDDTNIPFGSFINYLSNSLCFLGTVTIAFLWCLYVELRIYRNYTRASKRAKLLMIPWLIEVLILISNLFGSDFLFNITEDNVYRRGKYVVVVYIILLIYYVYSIYQVKIAKYRDLKVQFFPVNYFIGPCLIGTIVQLLMYGISAAWVSVAIALIFVQMQSHSENLLIDSLSGLFNRRYMSSLLNDVKYDIRKSFYGIMIDVNDFKSINDNYGHGKGDEAIRIMGDVLSSSIPNGAIAIRYAGDEFMILLPGMEERMVLDTMNEINKNLKKFNERNSEPFNLSVSMGYARIEKGDQNSESFLTRMDESMYQAKRIYHSKEDNER